MSCKKTKPQGLIAQGPQGITLQKYTFFEYGKIYNITIGVYCTD